MPGPKEIDYISYLVIRKFPNLDSASADNSGSREPSERYRKQLSTLANSELKKLYNAELIDQYLGGDQRQVFNEHDAPADFEYWSKMTYWTLDEAVALSFGKNPKIISGTGLITTAAYKSPFIEEFNKTKELALRAVKWSKLYDPVMPVLFVTWTKENGIPFPPELAKKVHNLSKNLVDWKKRYKDLFDRSTEELITANQIIDIKNQIIQELESSKYTEKPLLTRERETLLKLVIGMAISGYSYQPKEKRNSAVQEIADDLHLSGIGLDPDTVRKWLKMASELLPADYDNVDR
jgi:hypothetical protein